MKRFDPESIKERLMTRARQNSGWASILENGVISNLMDVYSEGLSEAARYMEFLLGEKKWTTATNMSSLLSMGKLIGRKRRRPQSACGYVIVSHTDAAGTDRLANLGVYFSDVNEPSNYDDITISPAYSLIESKALVPWTFYGTYSIPKGTVFTASNGAKFISTKTVSSRYLSESYTSILNNDTLYDSFISNGGWDGIKYVKVPVIQGEEVELDLGVAAGGRFETFMTDGAEIEAADNSISESYFYVEVFDNSENTSEIWTEVQNIRVAGANDKVFECYYAQSGDNLIFKFGDGLSGKMLTAGNRVKLHYLRTLGEAGNVNDKYSVKTMQFPPNVDMIDPRTGLQSTFLTCSNSSVINGGKDAEDYETYREEAPLSYIKSYATATTKEYEEKIKRYSPVSLMHATVFSDTNTSISVIDTSIEDQYAEVANEYTEIKNMIYMTALQPNGEIVDDPETMMTTIMDSLKFVKGPNDNISYIKPNLIKLSVGAIVNTVSTAYSEDEITSYVKTAIQDKYSIYNNSFRDPVYESMISACVKNFPFSTYTSTVVEAMATVDYDRISKLNYTDSKNPSASDFLILIPFKFDPIFAQDTSSQGFRNCENGAPYLLRVDMKFSSRSNQHKNRTFFLYDNRLTSKTTLEEAKKLPIDNTSGIPAVSLTKTDQVTNQKISIYDENSQYFSNRQVRVAQYNYIDDVMTDTNVSSFKSFSTSPSENRPYVVDSEGNNKTFLTSSVDPSLQEMSSSSSYTCYKINADFIKNVDIMFTEDYDNSSSGTYASGYVILPLSYLGLSTSQLNFNDTDIDGTLISGIKNSVSFSVYAQPKAKNFFPSKWNDLMYIPEEEIRVKRTLILDK